MAKHCPVRMQEWGFVRRELLLLARPPHEALRVVVVEDSRKLMWEGGVRELAHGVGVVGEERSHLA